jgi:diguanylate cyclase (GGDEF)-like protein
MLSAFTSSDVAFAMAGLSQTVPALLWLICAVVVRETRRASLNWAAFSALGAVSFGLFVSAQQAPFASITEPLRAAGNVTAVLSMMALHSGIRLFIGKTVPYLLHAGLLATVLLGSWIGLDPLAASIRVGVVCAVQAILSAGMAFDLYRYASATMKLKLPWLLPLPALVCGLIYVERCARAVLSAGAAQSQIAVASGLNVGSAFAYVVVTLSFHAMLLSLVLMRLIADLRRMSRHDSLTGLLNRRALEEELLLQVQRSLRGRVPFCVLMLDADHFKRINDRLGHGVGDLALKHLASLLRTQMRSIDTLGRVGGEEFVVVLPGLQEDAAVQAAERLRALVSNTPLPSATEPVAMSISIGVAQWDGHPEETTRLLMRADAALYKAKQDGRDRVALACAPASASVASG